MNGARTYARAQAAAYKKHLEEFEARRAAAAVSAAVRADADSASFEELESASAIYDAARGVGQYGPVAVAFTPDDVPDDSDAPDDVTQRHVNDFLESTP
jgi:hypothetical protein